MVLTMNRFPLNERYKNTSIITLSTDSRQQQCNCLASSERLPRAALVIAERFNAGQKFWLELDSAIRNLLKNSGVVLSYYRHHPPPYPFECSSWEAVGPRSATATHNRVFAPLGLLERDFNDHTGKLHNAKRVRHPSQEKICILFVGMFSFSSVLTLWYNLIIKPISSALGPLAGSPFLEHQ
jgi:hypothetical protein